jgi:hypothetical protein
MQSLEEELGILTAFIENLDQHAIPRALAVKKRVFDGELLNEIESMYFEQQLSEASSIMHLLDHHPEYQNMVMKMATLYNEVAEQALKNQIEKQGKSA